MKFNSKKFKEFMESVGEDLGELGLGCLAWFVAPFMIAWQILPYAAVIGGIYLVSNGNALGVLAIILGIVVFAIKFLAQFIE